jgi:hypothetical protein
MGPLRAQEKSRIVGLAVIGIGKKRFSIVEERKPRITLIQLLLKRDFHERILVRHLLRTQQEGRKGDQQENKADRRETSHEERSSGIDKFGNEVRKVRYPFIFQKNTQDDGSESHFLALLNSRQETEGIEVGPMAVDHIFNHMRIAVQNEIPYLKESSPAGFAFHRALPTALMIRWKERESRKLRVIWGVRDQTFHGRGFVGRRRR